MQLLNDAKQRECNDDFSGEWLICRKEVLSCNGSNALYFSQCVWELLEKGCRKYCNIMIAYTANCAKTFLLNPLNVIFDTFSNLTTFALVGAVSMGNHG